MSFAKKADKIITDIEKTIVATCLCLMMCIVFYGVFNRFVLKHSLEWSEELSRYLSIWATYVGASLGVRWGAHIGVEAFVDLLPNKPRQFINILSYLASLFFVVFLTVTGFQFTGKLIATHQMSPAMRVPMAWAYAGIPVGALFMSIRYLMLVLEEIAVLRRGKGELTNGDSPTLNI